MISGIAGGLDVLAREDPGLLRGQRIGIVATDGAVDRDFRDVISLVRALPGVELTRLFAPEHGIRGEAPDGAPIADGVDALTGLPVHSLHGPRFAPDAAALADLDALVYDIPDVGARYYTRAATLVNCLRAAASAGIRFVVLDRPNPIGGAAIEGPLLDPAFASFVGLPGLTIRHGLTLGEIARFFNDRERLDADLVVVAARGWRRGLWHDETNLPWIIPSPNLPTLDTATVYPGTCLVEGTLLSEGRGTTRPFEFVGAPFVDPQRLAAEMNGLSIPGVFFRPTSFQPAARKHANAICGGVQLHVLDRTAFRPVLAGVALLLTIARLWPDDFAWLPSAAGRPLHVDRLAGGPWLRAAVTAGAPPGEVAETWRKDEATFAEERRPYLLY